MKYESGLLDYIERAMRYYVKIKRRKMFKGLCFKED